MDWQKIETAPKDGTWLLVAWGGKTRLAKFLDNSDTARPWKGWGVPSLMPRPVSAGPTHWMPLPEPPE